MFTAIAMALALVIITFALHYQIFTSLAKYTPRLKLSAYNQMMVIILVIFTTHLVEIGLYAIAYYWTIDGLQLGVLEGIAIDDPMTYLYYSTVVYTSLGLGDIYPGGHIRFITGIETLNGFLLITWSASFTYLAMNRLLHWSNQCGSENNKGNNES